MTTKLTLSINEKTVKEVKRLSRKKGVSISKMVEEFLNNELKKEEEDPLEVIRRIMKPHVERINKSIPEGADYRELVRQWRYEDYNNKTASGKKAKKLKA